MNRFCFRRAEVIVAIGRCMVDRIRPRLGVGEQHKLRSIHVWADDANAGRSTAVPRFRDRWAAGPDQVVALYSGNMGRFHDIDCFVDAASLLGQGDRFSFWFVGQGYAKAGAMRRAATLGVTHCQFHDYVSRDDLPDLLASMDVGLVSLKPDQVGLSVPSKTYGLMAAGKPIIAVLPQQSEIAHVIREVGCGWVIDPGDIKGLVSAFHEVGRLSPYDRLAMGKRGQQAIVDRYGLKHAAAAYRQLIDYGLTPL